MTRCIYFFILALFASSIYAQWTPLYNGKLEGDICPLFAGGMDNARPTILDLDGDGDAELVWGCFDGYLRLWDNIAIPPLTDWRMVTDRWGGIHPTETHTCPTLGDLDGDGDLDLILGDWSGYLRLYRNVGGTPMEPIFELEDDEYLGFDIGGHSTPFLVDIDDDGDLDLFAGGNTGTIWYFRNEGTISEPAFTLVDSEYVDLEVYGYVNPNFFDMDSDGDYDMMIQHNRNVYYSENIGSATSPEWADIVDDFFPFTYHGCSGAICWDLEDSEAPELLVSAAIGNHYYYVNTGTGDSPVWELTPQPWETIEISYLVKIELKDLTGDGLPELLAFGYDSEIALENIGTPGDPDWQVNESLIEGIALTCECPALGDLDGDGDLDMVAGNYDTSYYYLENIGTPSAPVWDTPVTDWFGIYTGTFNSCALVDIDDDGDLDLFTGSGDRELHYYENTGSPTSPDFSSGLLLEEFAPYSSYIYRPGFCFYDFDDDGDYDLLTAADQSASRLTYWENTGDPTNPVWAEPVTNIIDTALGGLTDVKAWDYNGDGNIDLLCGTQQGGINLFLGSGFPGISEYQTPPRKFSLTAYPNPFNSSCRIEAPVGATIEIYDINGRLTSMTGKDAYPYRRSNSTVQHSNSPNTITSLNWHPGERTSSGVYLIKATVGNEKMSKKILYLK